MSQSLKPSQKKALQVLKKLTPHTVEKRVLRDATLLPTETPCEWGQMPTDLGVDWAFCLNTAFLDALDTRLTDQTIDKVKKKRWTQGSDFAFAVGNGLETAPQYPHHFVQILTVRPAEAAFVKKEKWEQWPENLASIIAKKEGLKTWQEEKKPTKKNPGVYTLCTAMPRDTGIVSGVLYEACSTDKTIWTAKKAFTTTQDAFIEFLITGHIKDLSIFE